MSLDRGKTCSKPEWSTRIVRPTNRCAGRVISASSEPWLGGKLSLIVSSEESPVHK
jgi:hypothetical protein